jgi:RNA polymerase sigma-70 factor (ECF subfamily)
LYDRRWVKLILKGDKAAGERFVTINYPRIYRLLRHLTGDAEVAEDLTQQTFIQAWQALASYRGEARLATWLHRIAYHEYTHWLRARRDEKPLEAAAHLADLRAAEGLDTILLARAMAQLTPELRDTFLLFYVQELSVSEVAAVLETPAGTIKSRLFTARQRLRELLQESARDVARFQETVPVPDLEKEVYSLEMSISQAQRTTGQ